MRGHWNDDHHCRVLVQCRLRCERRGCNQGDDAPGRQRFVHTAIVSRGYISRPSRRCCTERTTL